MDETDPLVALVDAAPKRDRPTLTSLLAQINALGYGTPEYFDCMAFLFITLARSQWRRADQARRHQTEDARRSTMARVPPATCPGCGRVLSVNRDGTMRKHDGPAGTAPCPGSRRPPVA